ncbi:MAG: hypothetical protein HKN70_00435, partial [Gammaproteobacteria bacterium]|nr:hypothetical protein [Gammaproteobacteria bacterium]
MNKLFKSSRKIMKNLTPQHRFPLATTVLKTLLLSFLFANSASAQQTLSDYSVLPENLTGDVTTNPNVLIIVDNSTSMERFFINGPNDGSYGTDPETGVKYLQGSRRHQDASSSFSNSYKVREAMIEVLDSEVFRGRLNVGIMAFGQNRCLYNENDNDPADNSGSARRNQLEVDCQRPDGTDVNPIGTTGLGVLRANIAPLDGAHKDTVLELIALEPTPWTDVGTQKNISALNGDDYVVLPPAAARPINGLVHPFHQPAVNGLREINGRESTILTLPGQNGQTLNFNLTPLGGSLETAFRYLFANDPTADTALPVNSTFRGGVVNRENGLPDAVDPVTNVTTPGVVNYLNASQCDGPMTVILLTDGDPSQLPPSDLADGIGAQTSQGASDAVTSGVTAARRIHYRGYSTIAAGQANVPEEDRVDVHVIGFQLDNVDAANQIAAAGGTDQAVLANSTAEVAAAFTEIFSDILTKGASRSGISIIGTPDAATGSFVQPEFTPLIEGTNEEVVWTGQMRNFYIDRFGNFREDTPGGIMAELDGTDLGFRILYDDETEQTYVERFNVGADGTQTNLTGNSDGAGGFVGGLIEVEDLNPIWGAHEQLNALDDSIASIDTNRVYENVPGIAGSRYIFTGIDANKDNSVTANEVIDFEWNASTTAITKINPNNKGYFDLPAGADSNTDAEELVNFIRGAEISTMRNRTIGTEKYLLGDIVHSTPVQVDGPIPLSFSTNPVKTQALQDSYQPFSTHYADRRKMIYVGANDGMLHAFNGGFWNVDTALGTVEIDRQRSGLTSDTNFALGDEVWAYIPQAVLPHLKFLADPDYLADQHISYVDGSLQSYAVKIFDGKPGNCANVGATDTAGASCKYVNGWGTILVGGLRLGGADYTANMDGLPGDETMRSSFFI